MSIFKARRAVVAGQGRAGRRRGELDIKFAIEDEIGKNRLEGMG